MIAQKKYCEIILNAPTLLGTLIIKDGGSMKPDCILRNLQRESPTIRRSKALFDTLEEAGYTKEEIFQKGKP
ncbi:hypothetical protein [Chryseobacterium potabilaquae]|uniref:Uncharacterized protein n=1 Tax=Chryseobacterium potabilaquae TaxID=2675057 RepID=A0A6N4XE02_9FLAO|nr:hypothetical protein [Chryseobacterium potabilaquae]CAA7196849.1 hypothetical protein CHRY9293_02915 [Chryseobacterium potabilaquae]